MPTPSSPTAAALLTLCLGLTAHPLCADSLDPLELPTVLSATRLKQAPADVPGSMTVLDRELIRASGARNIPEILRLVPGMHVGYRRGNQMNVNLHGTNVTEARRLQVLVDGRSVYRPGLATVDWSELALAIEDIDRIEVFRGPNTAAYGANALMGVINIVTRLPMENHGTTLKYTQGTRGVRDVYASHSGGSLQHNWRMSLSTQQDNGFDHDKGGNDYRDGMRATRFNLRHAWQLAPNQTLDWQMAASEASRQSYYEFSTYFNHNKFDKPLDQAIAAHQPDADIRGRDFSTLGLWKLDINPDHQLQVQAYAQHAGRLRDWRVCESPVAFSPALLELSGLSQLAARRVRSYLESTQTESMDSYIDYYMGIEGEAYTPQMAELAARVRDQVPLYNNGDPVCGRINENIRETRTHVEIQDVLRLTPELRLLSGASYRHDRASSETFFNGTVDNQVTQLFGNLEYRPNQRWLFQAGGMYEYEQLIGDSFSPRLATHFFLAPLHSLRLVYAEAVRSPDMYENHANWHYRLREVTGPLSGPVTHYGWARGPGDLHQERMRSHEVGYNGHFPLLGLQLDVRAFQERVTGMNSEPLKVDDFRPDNRSSIRFKGAEGELDWAFSSMDRLRLTYAYIAFDASNKRDSRLTARHSGSAAWLREWPGQIRTSLIYYGADHLNELRFERLDSRIEKQFALADRSSLALALTWQYRLDDEALTWEENRFDSRSHYYLSAELNF
ncbi:iron complex outermembrane recepter protein [Halopseudomonas formosensis]|uniref:Iron complex outermembrane recepter protein n=1 Tax=Halopseudomonas formosensis TaxID=1002526 RepID=A0A1I6BI32_9GAMM|nr:TonB-dependent receptor [Halopseudomonas formosensis]SFQ80564.1 iron complex outermembrane recepter protein [Halopseudomonas formosensis]